MYSRSSASMSLVWISALLLAGCSSPPAQTPSATPVESSSTPTLTEDPNAYQPATKDGPAKNVPVPEMPELAKQETAEGREAFMYYYFELLNYTIEARDPKPIANYTAKGAQYPENYAGMATTYLDENLYAVDVRQTIKSISISPTPDPRGVYSGQITADFTEFNTYKDGKHAREPEPPLIDGNMTFTMYWLEGKWIVNSMVLH